MPTASMLDTFTAANAEDRRIFGAIAYSLLIDNINVRRMLIVQRKRKIHQAAHAWARRPYNTR